MRVKPPAGKKITEITLKLKTLEEVSEKLKRRCVLIKFSGAGEGWVIINRKKIVAAYFFGKEEYPGLRAVAEIEKILKEGCRVSVFEMDSRILGVFTGMYPEIAIDEDVKNASFGARIRSDTENAAVTAESSQFTEEWEESTTDSSALASTEKKVEREEVQKEAETEEIEEATEQVDVKEDLLHTLRGALGEENRIKREASVINLQDFIDQLSIERFSGIVRGYDGSIEITVYMKGGNISAAIVKDEDIEIKGDPALFYLETPARVLVEEKAAEDVVFPEDAVCGVDEDARSKLYRSLQ